MRRFHRAWKRAYKVNPSARWKALNDQRFRNSFHNKVRKVLRRRR